MAGWEARFNHKEYFPTATLELSENFKRRVAARSDYESNYKRAYEQKGETIAVNIPVV